MQMVLPFVVSAAARCPCIFRFFASLLLLLIPSIFCSFIFFIAHGFGTGGSYVRRGKDRARPTYSGGDIFSRTWVLVVLGYSVLKYDEYEKKLRICVLP